MNDITVVIPSSAIPSHPDTRVLDETLATVRAHLPDSEIIITLDGVHENYAQLTEAYNQYKTTVLWRCLHKYKNVLPIVFDHHEHQSGMLHEAIKEIKTPLVLYVEHDTPLTPDRAIDWNEVKQFIYDGHATTVRLLHEEVIPDPHRGLMLGEQGHFIKTAQWSQRPHLTTKIYYEEMLKHFPSDAKSFIEDYWHGVVQQDCQDTLGWYKHRLWIYNPDDPIGMKRSYTTDGREGMVKVGEGF